jgi:hypothetical protein
MWGGGTKRSMWEGSLQVATEPFAGEVIDRIGLLCDAARLATATATAARSAVCTVDGEKEGERARGNNSTTPTHRMCERSWGACVGAPCEHTKPNQSVCTPLCFNAHGLWGPSVAHAPQRDLPRETSSGGGQGIGKQQGYVKGLDTD